MGNVSETAEKGEDGEEFGEREQGQAGSWAKQREAVKSPQGENNDVYYSFLRAKIPFDPNPLIQAIVLTSLWKIKEEEPASSWLK